MRHVLSWLVGLTIYAVRATCRVQIHNDPRAHVRRGGHGYVFAQLHAHQIAASMFGEVGTAAMVSRSADGEMIVPTLRLCGKTPVRGSSGVGRKGGATALHAMIQHVRDGKPAVIAVDGPRGPRGQVHKGIGLLAQKSNTFVIPVIVIPARRWIVSKTWDRLQIPKPFATVHVHFGEPIPPHKDLDVIISGVQNSLEKIESSYDPSEHVKVIADGKAVHRLRSAA